MTEPRRTVQLTAHGMEWLTVCEFAEAVPLLEVDRARHPDELTPEEFVKDNTVRTVLRLPDPLEPAGPGLYVKRYKFRDLSDRLKYLVGRTKALQEWRVCRALQAAQTPTCDVLAIAVHRRRGLPREGFLVSREIAGAVDFTRFCRESLAAVERDRPGYRVELVEELAERTADLVNGRFYHYDYHAGNLLMRPDAARGERLFVVDLHAIRLRAPGRRGLERMLGMLLGRDAPLGSEAPEREAFLRTFLSRWRGGPGACDESVALWQRRIERAGARLHNRHVRSRTRRCLVSSTLFTVERARGFLVHRRRDFPLKAALEAAECHRAAVDGGDGAARVLGKSRRTEVTVCPSECVPPFGVGRPGGPEDVKAGSVCVKAFPRDALGARLKDMLRLRGRARTTWIASRGFEVRGIPGARPLALLEARRKLSGRPDYVIMEALETDGSLGELTASGLTPARRRHLASAVARLLDLLATERVYHPDTKPTNFLVSHADGELQLWLVDLDRASFDTPLTRSRWIKCLVRLNSGLGRKVTLLDRMRCLRACGRGRWTARERLAIGREVLARSLTRRAAWLFDGP